MLNLCNRSQQLGLFTRVEAPSAAKAMGAPDPFTDGKLVYKNQMRVIRDTDPVVVHITPNQVIAEMARQQRQNLASSKRARQDCDTLSLSAKMAVSFWLGECWDTVYQDWKGALKRGNRGVFWSTPTEAIGLRTIPKDKKAFSINKTNRNADRITAHVVARVALELTGEASIEILGLCYSHQISRFLKDLGDYYHCPLPPVEEAGLLHPPSDIKQLIRGYAHV